MSEVFRPSMPSGQYIDVNRPLTFTFQGRPIPALAGQSIAAALYAAGVRIFSRSFKYHRPRGLLCVSGDCPNCLMQVNGRPNVRTCIEPARPGQAVVHQNAWPSLDFDVLRVFDYLDWFLPVGFYYKRFHKPRWLWPWFERVVRRIAGLGKIDVHAVPETDVEVEHLQTDVCVVGGGPAGLAAAAEAAHNGARVLLIERQRWLGGHCLFIGGYGESFLDEALASVHNQPRLQVLTDTAVFGLYEGNYLGAFQRDRFLKIRAKHIIICTGGRQRPFLFHNNDLPGIFLSDGVLRLARLHGVKAGRKAVVVTDQDDGGSQVAAQLQNLGIEVAAVIDQRPPLAPPYQGGEERVSHFQGLQGGAAWPILRGHVVLQAVGHSYLEAVRVAPVNAHGHTNADEEIPCDLLCLASRRVPANELLLQGGVRFRQESGRWLVDRGVPGLTAAGASAGTLDLAAQINEGRLRGAEAAIALGYPAHRLEHYRQTWNSCQGAPPLAKGGMGGCLLPPDDFRQGKCFVCLCEDVTEKDLAQAVAEGFDNIETLKRYSTVNMGPCQGKMCGQNAVEVCARLTQREVNAVGTTTSRPPAVPVDLCLLAADRRYHPVRRTPLHHWHESAGAKWMDAGQWERPESYGDAVAEVRAVRQRVGLIDVSTLGKIELIGPDATILLERIYLNRWADLKGGRVRYGALCTEEGILFDDGVAARLATDRFFLTATTGNAEAVFQWLDLWRATWGLDVILVNQTSAMAAMNLAGPRSREVLSRLTKLNLSPTAFPYLSFQDGDVAGVPCRLLRIGFVGELGYEIHCPSALAGPLWEAILEAGKDLGIQPFAVEAQRILRLEKGHLIIGVDTDALSNPLEAGLEGMIRFDKSLFHGREPLLRLQARGPRSRLVGFHLKERNPEDLRDLEGCQVIEGGRPVGRVTSARYSPTQDCSLGLAWVPAARAQPGQGFVIRYSGADVTAAVARLPFYDPEMKRLKS